MEKNKTILISFVWLLLTIICVFTWSAEVKISQLEKQLQSLQNQKEKLDSERHELLKDSNKLSFEIEELKIQSQGGLGIIGRYKLSRKLRKAQSLSEDIQSLEKQIYNVEKDISDKKKMLRKEYDKYIEILIDKLSKSQDDPEQKQILKELNSIKQAKEKLAKPQEQKLEFLDISKIEIKDYDGPQEIREKADLINDFAAKYNSTIDRLAVRIERLKEEIETRSKLGEFAEEISFFGDRILKEELVVSSDSEIEEISKQDNGTTQVVTLEAESVTKSDGLTEADTFDGDRNADVPITDPPDISDTTLIDTQDQPLSITTGRMVVERNGISVDLTENSFKTLEEAILLLEKQKKELKNQLKVITEKANSFYKKADEIEKSETGKGENTRSDHLDKKTAR